MPQRIKGYKSGESRLGHALFLIYFLRRLFSLKRAPGRRMKIVRGPLYT